MQHTLRKNAALYALLVAMTGFVFIGCIDEPNPTVPDKLTAPVRFFHAVPDGPAVDLYIDGERVISGLQYKQAQQYMNVNAGSREFRLSSAGMTDILYSSKITVRALMQTTVVFHGMVANNSVAALITQEHFTYSDETKKLKDSADVKFINTQTDALALVKGDISGTTLVTVNPKALSRYFRVLAGSSDFTVTRSGALVKTINYELKYAQTQGYRYTFIATGDDLVPLQDDPR